jgi:hypothetical protein
MRERVRLVAALEPREWRALADGVLAAARIEVGLRTRPLSRVIAWVESRPPRPSPGEVDGRRLFALAAWPYRVLGVSPSCLRRSLVLTALLRQRRRPAVLCVGVRKDGPNLRAHAWVECGPASFDTSNEPFERLQPSAAGELTRSARWLP